MAAALCWLQLRLQVLRVVAFFAWLGFGSLFQLPLVTACGGQVSTMFVVVVVGGAEWVLMCVSGDSLLLLGLCLRQGCSQDPPCLWL